MDRWLKLSLLGTTLLLLSAVDARAQSQGIGLEVNAGYDILTGDDFDAFENGLGFEVIGSHAWTSGWELGVGAGFSSHDLDGLDGPSADQINVFGEARYRFGVPAAVPTHTHPFVLGRLGYTRLDVDDDASQSGLLAGAGGGVEYWLTDEVGILGAGVLQLLSYGDSDDVPVERDGVEFNLHGGLKVRFP